jgi:hypothetical protein
MPANDNHMHSFFGVDSRNDLWSALERKEKHYALHVVISSCSDLLIVPIVRLQLISLFAADPRLILP